MSKPLSYLYNQFYYVFNPEELRSIIQWSVWHNAVHERNEETEAPSLRMCFKFLDMTSRSFATVIKELNPELLVPVCIFYLVLRGLDTIEDDMTIPLNIKEPILRDFHNIMEKDGWNFDGCASREKDRELLVQFQCVIEEYKKIKPEYKVIIRDITERMGNGMADNCVKAEKNNGLSVETVPEYEQYCHYVAGILGEGLTKLFVESKLANPALLSRPDLQESMGQMLQQTNIIRDIKEDYEDRRRYWPKSVWSKYVDNFEDLLNPKNREAALRCSSEMVLIALNRATDSMFYMAGVKDQSVFNFAGIPQTMAIATLEACFRNPLIFERNVKITKGAACQIMLDSSQDLKTFYACFLKHARMIQKKNNPMDPNFLKISVACGKIEQFIESIFPSQDPKAIVKAASTATGHPEPMTKEQEAAAAKKKVEDAATSKEMIYLGLAVVGAIVFMVLIMFFVAWLLGARFDLAWAELRQNGIFKRQEPAELTEMMADKAHREL